MTHDDDPKIESVLRKIETLLDSLNTQFKEVRQSLQTISTHTQHLQPGKPWDTKKKEHRSTLIEHAQTTKATHITGEDALRVLEASPSQLKNIFTTLSAKYPTDFLLLRGKGASRTKLVLLQNLPPPHQIYHEMAGMKERTRLEIASLATKHEINPSNVEDIVEAFCAVDNRFVKGKGVVFRKW